MFCPYCGTSGDRKRFCTQCGAALLRNQPPATPVVNAVTKESFVQIDSAPKTGALTGLVLDQKYRLESKLGEGGTGIVYRARRLLIGDSAAVKLLHPDQMGHPKAVERFRREAQIAARLKHENLVNVYDFGVSKEGLIYFVMEIAEGVSLRQMIEDQGKLTETMTAEIMRQVCAAIDDAHRRGVVHRDLKPENILVHTTPRGLQVKVLDFGISAQREIAGCKLTRTGGVIGTPHYMSPEQCKGEELDGRSDIYSLGIVLFEMLTGVVPFNSSTPTAIVVQQVNQTPPPLREINPKISPAVEAIVLHALAKQPGARPQTAGELARDLSAALNRANDSATRPSAVTMRVADPKFDKRPAKTGSTPRRALLLVAALLLLVVAAGGGFSWHLRKSGSGQPVTDNHSATNSQQSSTVSGPAAAPNGNATTPASTEQLQASNDLWEVIPDQTSNTTDAGFAVGSTDQQMALIKSGGQLALNFREGRFFGDGEGADLHVHGPEQELVSYTIFVRDDSAGDWRKIDINRKGFPQGLVGHDMGHHGVRRARQLLIKNDGNTDLSIDAATAVYKDKVSGNGHSHRTPLKKFAANSVTAHQRARFDSKGSRSAPQSAHCRKRRNSDS